MTTVTEPSHLSNHLVESCGRESHQQNTRRTSTPQQNSQADLFPCRHPHKPSMRHVDDRIASFGGWPNHMRATPRKLAEAGLYYIHIADRTKCFYCNGGLENWECDDDPWVEHAKFYPECEYLLREKGVEFVSDVKARNQNLPSPVVYPASSSGASVINMENATITVNGNNVRVNPSLSPNTGANFYQTIIPGGNFVQQSIMPGQGSITSVHETVMTPDPTPTRSLEDRLNEAMQNELSLLMINFGFSEELLERVIRKKLSRSSSSKMFESASEFLDALEEQRRSDNPGQVVTSENHTQASGSQIPEQMETQEVSPQNTESSAQDRIQELMREKRCKICLDQDSSCIFEPCGHMCACLGCGTRLRECPICRRRISTIRRVYTS